MTPENKNAVEFRDVNLTLNETEYFRNLNLDIRKGETFVVYSIGNSGKSFLLRFVMGLIRPTTGTVTVQGTDVGSLAQDELYRYRQRIRFVSRDSDLINNLSVFNNIALSLDFHTNLPQKALHREVNRIIGQFHLEDYRDEHPINLYENIKKRVGLARALIASPEILLMDECAYGYDDITAKGAVSMLFGVIGERHGDMKPTTVITTSDLDLYCGVADRIGILFNREMIFTGTYEELVGSHQRVLKQILAGDEELIRVNREYFSYGAI